MSAFEWREAPRAEFAVVGDPVAHSSSPAMHHAAYEALGLACRYVALRVRAGELEAALAHCLALGYRGVNVTVPLKEEALEWARTATPIARRAGAANTLDLAEGAADNTDVPGFTKALAAICPSPAGGALVLGAGGSARAVVLALQDSGWDVALWARRRERAEALAARIGGPVGAVEDPDLRGMGLLVNATAAGLAGEVPPVPWDTAAPGLLALDLAYGPAARPFVDAARRAGLVATDGKAMLVEQGALSFEHWLGIAAPRDVMLKAIP